MKTVLITGVAGMIGSHLADELLAKGYKVLGLDNLSVGKRENIAQNLANPRFTFKKVDIRDYKKLQDSCKGIHLDAIVHLTASKKISEEGSALDVLTNNVRPTENTLALAQKKKCKFILGSTSDVYGVSADIPFKEEGNLLLGAPTAKRWAYAASKMYAEHLAFAYYKERNVPVIVLRYFGAFSPRASFSWRGGHIPLFIDAVLQGRDIIIHGNGRQTRSMAYISDVISGTVLALENKKAVGNIFNIGSDEELSVIASAHLIKKLAGAGTKTKIRFVPIKKIFGDYREIKRRVPSLANSKRILGYRPKVSLQEGLAITIKARREWIRENADKIRRKN
ncbi:MAG: SDR family NAD(P)-dependent oxidoreductase [Candidatus Omnitrophota bacterium]